MNPLQFYTMTCRGCGYRLTETEAFILRGFGYLMVGVVIVTAIFLIHTYWHEWRCRISGPAARAVLDVLRDRPGYGLDVLDRARDQHGPRVVTMATLHPTLRNLERAVYVSREEHEGTTVRRGRPRYLYALTPAGRRFLEDR